MPGVDREQLVGEGEVPSWAIEKQGEGEGEGDAKYAGGADDAGAAAKTKTTTKKPAAKKKKPATSISSKDFEEGVKVNFAKVCIANFSLVLCIFLFAFACSVFGVKEMSKQKYDGNDRVDAYGIYSMTAKYEGNGDPKEYLYSDSSQGVCHDVTSRSKDWQQNFCAAQEVAFGAAVTNMLVIPASMATDYYTARQGKGNKCLQFLSSTLTFGIGLCWMCVTFSWSACHMQLKNYNTDNTDVVLGDAFVVSLIAMFVSFLLFYVKFKVFCQKDEAGQRGYQRTSSDTGPRRASSSRA